MDEYQLKQKIKTVKQELEKYGPPQSSPLYERVIEDLAKGAESNSIIVGLLSIIEYQEGRLKEVDLDNPGLSMRILTMHQMDRANMLERRTRKVDVPDHLNKLPITPEEAFKATSSNP